MKLEHFGRKERTDLWGIGHTFVTHLLLQYLILPQKGGRGMVCTKCSSTCSGSAIPFGLWNILVYFDSFCFWHLDLKL
jgi:hypothetical protein